MKERLGISEGISTVLLNHDFDRTMKSGFDGVYYLVHRAMKNIDLSINEIQICDDFEISPLTISLGYSVFSDAIFSLSFGLFLDNYQNYLNGEITQEKLIKDFYQRGLSYEGLSFSVPQNKDKMLKDELIKLFVVQKMKKN